jgi:outer membrane biogenesis lipoprotein LolB
MYIPLSKLADWLRAHPLPDGRIMPIQLLDGRIIQP